MKTLIPKAPNIREKLSEPSKLTLKNYAADTRKFIRWYESTYSRSFPPKIITKEIIDAYLSPIYDVSPRSAKRYTSSLRKFFHYLVSEATITYNPLVIQKELIINQDIWHIRDFKNHLYNLKKTPITIKNYLSDINQFTSWIEKVALKPEDYVQSIEIKPNNTLSNQTNPFAKINLTLVEEYKKRLLAEANLSPLSVNRKLSSLRQFFIWASNTKRLTIDSNFIEKISNIKNQTSLHEDNFKINDELPEASLESLRQVPNQNTDEQAKNLNKDYSTFPPFRLIQKSSRLIGILFDVVFVLSIIKAIENLKFSLWKATGKQVFAPIPEVMKSIHSGIIPNTASILQNNIKQEGHTGINLQEIHTRLDKLMRINENESLTKINGLPKSFYAPDKISTRALPFWKKITHHLRNTRPKWYKKYHSYTFIHYIHFGVAIIIAVILGLRIYQPFLNFRNDPMVLGVQKEPQREVQFQGSLKDKDGLPITNERKIRFSIYNSKTASGSALLWEEVKKIKPEANGKFSTTLGKANPIKQSIFSGNPSLFLGITIGTEPELTPRESLANYLLSANSETLQGLKPITGNNAGTENVILALDSSGNLTIGGNSDPIFQATGGSFSLRGEQLILSTNPGSEGNIILNPDGSGIIDIIKPIQNTSEDIITGLGTNAVQIDDELAINSTSSARPALQINQNGTGDLISAQLSGTAKFSVSNSGTVTIGEDLKIIGNNLQTVTGTFNLINTITKNINLGGEATDIRIGAKSGRTTINHDLEILGSLKINKGIILPGFTEGSIPFIGADSRIASDSANLFWDRFNKRLGIGTSTPNSRLSIQDNVSISGKAVAIITNSNPADSVNNTALRLNSGVSTTGTQARFITFYANCSSDACTGTAKGNIAVSASGVSYNSGSADFAEYFKKHNPEEKFDKGDLVCYAQSEGVEKCNKQSNGILGVVSMDAGFVGNSNFENNPAYVLVGLIGQLEARVSPATHPIKPGDPIGVNFQDGSIKKSISAGQIVGRALENYDPKAQSKQLIKISLNVSWYDPNAVLMNNGTLITAFETIINNEPADSYENDKELAKSIQDFINTLNTGVLRIRNLSVDSINITTDNITIGTQTLKEYIAGIVDEILDKRQAQAKNDESEADKIVILNPLAEEKPVSSPSPTQTITPFPTQIPSPSISEDEKQATNSASITNITNIYNNASTSSAETASLSATPSPSPAPSLTTDQEITSASQSASEDQTATPSALPTLSDEKPIFENKTAEARGTLRHNPANIASFSAELSYVPNLNAGFGKFDNGLIALGPSSLTDVTVSSQISIGGNLQISNKAIDTVGSDLNLQPLRQGNLSFMSGLVIIDTQGNLNVEGNANFAQDVNVRGRLAAGIISPIDESDLVIQLGNNQNKEDKNINAESSFVINDSNGRKVIAIDQKGNLLASGSAIFSNLKLIRGAQADTSFTETIASASAGTAVITTNETERTIVTPYVQENSLIYITSTSDTKGINPYIARQTAENSSENTRGSFTIQIPRSTNFDIKLNWIIIN